MNESLHRYIFLIQRGSGDMLSLHPFRSGDAVFRHPENVVLEGRYATEPDAGKTDTLRSILHMELEKGARADALDRGFYPRLLVSAAVFLVLYMFLSIVVRDPVPLIDEFLVGGMGAIACWFFLERRVLSSTAFAQRVSALRKALDSALFQSSRVSRSLEESLQDAETLDPGKYAEFLAYSLEFDASEEERQELSALANALESKLPADAVAEIGKLVSESADSKAFIRKILGRKRLDLPMLLSYARVHASLKVET